MVVIAIVLVGSVHVLTRCLKRIFCPNWYVPDLDVYKMRNVPAGQPGQAAAAAAVKKKEE